MIIQKNITNDYKEKNNSIELRIYVPTIDLNIDDFKFVNKYSEQDSVMYYFDTDTLEHAEEIFSKFIEHLSKIYNRSLDYFKIEEI